MAHITTVSHGNYASVPRRSYLSTEPFNTAIYSYSTALVNQVYVGTLTVLPTATLANCPAGRILHETGKKLFPGANNGINDYMVSVYDPVSLLTGFINPNDPLFSLMNTDRANFLLDGPNGAGTGLSAPARANALYTRGDVLAGGRMDLSGSALVYGSITSRSTIVAQSGVVANSGQVRVNATTSYLALNNSSITVDPTLSQVYQIRLSTCTSTSVVVVTTPDPLVNGNLNGAFLYFIVPNEGTSNVALDFNAYFRAQNAGNSVVNAGAINTYSFFCNGANFFQIAQTTSIAQ
jgi:hypothetical protein